MTAFVPDNSMIGAQPNVEQTTTLNDRWPPVAAVRRNEMIWFFKNDVLHRSNRLVTISIRMVFMPSPSRFDNPLDVGIFRLPF